jgi:4-amino-4-deoxy-L-arabinose transferase-like glycosyltransferase
MSKFNLSLLIIVMAVFFRVWLLEGIDITADEFHYINDAQRLLEKDPYISIRHHPFQHIFPHMGHPFLVQILTVVSFKILGKSVFSARLVSALAGVGVVILLLFFRTKEKKNIGMLAASLLAVIPLAIRFSRDAHLDSLLTLWSTAAALFVWLYAKNKQKVYLVLAGLMAGLAISTKLDGLIVLVLSLVLLISLREKKKNSSLYIILPTLIVSFLLNDPQHYLEGILNPADPSYNLLSLDFWIKSLTSIKFWSVVLFELLSPVFLVLWIGSNFLLIKKVIKEKSIFAHYLIFWQFILMALFIFHRPTVSGEYGLMPAIPPMAMAVSYGLYSFKIKRNTVRMLAILLFINLFYFSFLYGLRFRQVSYLGVKSVFNRKINDKFYLSVIRSINQDSLPKAKLFLSPSGGYPLINLRDDISWSYYGEIDSFDTYVVDEDSLSILEPIKNKLELTQTIHGRQDGDNLTRFLFKKSIQQKI